MINTVLCNLLDDEFEEMTDEEIVEVANNGNNEALNFIMEKYKDIVNIKVNKYFIVGAEKDDIIQEGLIGLYKAIINFKRTKDNSFKSFANLCIERQLITAIKTSNRQKHIPLNSYLSLNMPAYEDANEDSESIIDILNPNLVEDPLDTITKKEYYNSIETAMNRSLSSFEKSVLDRFSKGDSYEQIATRLNTPVKSIDNAIQRIRKKASRDISDR